MKKKALSILLTLTMLLTLVPAFGTVASAEPQPLVSYCYPEYNTTTGTAYEQASSGIKEWHDGSRTDYTMVTSSDAAWGTAGNATWYLATGEVSISNTITVSGDVYLILDAGAKLTITGPEGGNAIYIPDGNSFQVYAQSNNANMGTLTVTGTAGGKGVAGNQVGASLGGSLIIHGGNVTISGGKGGDGASEGGKGGTGGNGVDHLSAFIINGGNVTVSGGDGGTPGTNGSSGESGAGVTSCSTLITAGDVTLKNGTPTQGNGSNSSSQLVAKNALQNGNLTINGGTFSAVSNCEGVKAINIYSPYTFTISSAFVLKTSSDGTNYTEVTDANSDGYQDDVYNMIHRYLKTDTPDAAAVTIDSTTTNYSTIAAAWTAAEAAGTATVKLLSDVTTNLTVASGKNITLDLNGYVLSGTGSGSVITNNGTLYIVDSDTTAVHYLTDEKCFHGNEVGKSCSYYNCGGTAKKDGCFETLYSGSGTPSGTLGTDYIALTGGCITGGTGTTTTIYAGDTSCGGGIYNAGALILQSGNIVGNSAKFGAGVYVAALYDSTEKVYSPIGDGGSTFTMTGGRICSNCAGTSGGGVLNYATFTMTGGCIDYNTASNGTGVYSGVKKHPETSGATTLENELGDCTISGTAQICNNVCNTASNSASGAYCFMGRFTVGGSAKITGNGAKSNGKASNLGIRDRTVSIGTGIDAPNGMLIGVTMRTTVGTFTTNGESTDVKYFTSDNSDYKVKYDTDNHCLKLAEIETINSSHKICLKDGVARYDGLTKEPIPAAELSAMGLSYDEATDVWTMNNFRFTTTASTALAVYYGTTIKVVGTNTLTSNYTCTKSNERCMAFSSMGDVKFIGDGTLTCTAKEQETGWSIAIYSTYRYTGTNQNFVFYPFTWTIDGPTIRAVAGASSDSEGIQFYGRANDEITYGTLVVKSGLLDCRAYGDNGRGIGPRESNIRINMAGDGKIYACGKLSAISALTDAPQNAKIVGSTTFEDSEANLTSAQRQYGNTYITMDASPTNIAKTAVLTYSHSHEGGLEFTQKLSGTATSAVTLGTAGQKSYYYLSGDYKNVANTAITVAGTVYLCLNDCVLDLNGGKIEVNDESALYIYDCGTTVRYFKEGTANSGCYDTQSDTAAGCISVTGGCITGGKAHGIKNFGTLLLAGGNIVGNIADDYNNVYGGGAYNAGDFTMTGGTIIGNKAALAGGGVSNNVGTFTMTGGSIVGNTAGSADGGMGGGVVNAGAFTMTGGSISGNKAATAGGGVCALLSVTFGDTAKITGNQLTNGTTNNLILYNNALAAFSSQTAPETSGSNKMSIGVSPYDLAALEMGKQNLPAVITSAVVTDELASCFFADSTDNRVSKVASGDNVGKLQLEAIPVIEDITGTVTVNGGEQSVANDLMGNLPNKVSDTNVRTAMNGASQLQIALKSLDVNTTGGTTVTKAKFDVKPMDHLGNEITTASNGAVTFKLPVVAADSSYKSAQVFKGDKAIGTYAIDSTSVTVSVDKFTGGTYSYELSKVDVGAVNGTNYQVSISLKDNIDMNLYVTPATPSTITGYHVKATFNDETTIDRALEAGESDTKIKIAEIRSYEMTKSAFIQVFYTIGEDTIVVKSFDFSVRDYCRSAKAQYPSDESLATVCDAILNYGAQAQIYFDAVGNYWENGIKKAYNIDTDDLANNAINPDNEVVAPTQPSAKTSWTGDLSNTNAVGVTLLLGSETGINIYVKFKSGVNASNYTAKLDGEDTTLTLETNGDYAGFYYAKVAGMAPTQLAVSHTLVITGGESAGIDSGKADTIICSAESYAASKWNVSSKNLDKLVQTLISYGNAAVAYSVPQ